MPRSTGFNPHGGFGVGAPETTFGHSMKESSVLIPMGDSVRARRFKYREAAWYYRIHVSILMGDSVRARREMATLTQTPAVLFQSPWGIRCGHVVLAPFQSQNGGSVSIPMGDSMWARLQMLKGEFIDPKSFNPHGGFDVGVS